MADNPVSIPHGRLIMKLSAIVASIATVAATRYLYNIDNRAIMLYATLHQNIASRNHIIPMVGKFPQMGELWYCPEPKAPACIVRHTML